MDLKSFSQQKIIILRVNLSLACIEGMVVFKKYLTAPSETESAVFLQYSALRLILLLAVLFMLLAIFFELVATFKNNWLDHKLGRFIDGLWNRTATFWFLLVLGGLIYFLLFASDRNLASFASYRERLYPILVWFGLIVLQFAFSFIYLKGIESGLVRAYGNVLLPSGIALLALFAFVVFISLTQIGVSPDARFWQKAGAPILLPQVLFAWAAGLTICSLITRLKVIKSIKTDIPIGIVLWGLACALWLSQPLRPSYNSLAPSAPNFQSYPFADSMIYDLAAHEYLIGKPIPSEFGVKPLYSLFLAFLHFLVGERYVILVSLQIVVLAVIPVLVYLITASLSNRPAGLVAALLIIIRERNGIALSNVIEVSHVKLLMSDIFAMGLVAFSIYLLLRWLDQPSGHRASLFAVGGTLSLLTLTRGHPIILVPLVFCIIFLVLSIPLRLRLQSALLFALGVSIPLILWIWRVHEISGEFALQDPDSSYTTHLARSYSLTPNVPSKLNGETDEEYYARLRELASNFIEQHPEEVLKFTSSHYVHNSILSYIYLPHSFQIESLREYVKTEPFWQVWEGELDLQEKILLGLNLCFIGVGIGGSWRKKRLSALVPVLIGAGYNVSVSIGRVSGWRYIQPSDWITLVYYSIGLVQFAYMIKFVLTRSTQEDLLNDEIQASVASSQGGISKGWIKTILGALIFFLIGMALTYGYRLFSDRYPAKSTEQLIREYVSTVGLLGESFTENELNAFVGNNNAVIAYGQAIYPYYLKANSGPVNHALPAFKPRPYNRLVFYLRGPESSTVVLPIPSHDFDFPDAAEVIVLGCKTETGSIDAISVLITGDQPSVYTPVPVPELACPPP